MSLGAWSVQPALIYVALAAAEVGIGGGWRNYLCVQEVPESSELPMTGNGSEARKLPFANGCNGRDFQLSAAPHS